MYSYQWQEKVLQYAQYNIGCKTQEAKPSRCCGSHVVTNLAKKRLYVFV